MLFAAVLTQPSIDYLKLITQASPIEFYLSPRVYLSAPTEGVDPYRHSSIEEVVGKIVPLRFAAARTLFNVNTQRSEFDVLLNADLAVTSKSAREALLPLEHPQTFTPYFAWCIEPNRSRTARAFMVSLTNSLQTDNFQFSASIQLIGDQDPLHLVFNPATLTSAALDSSQLYNQKMF